MTHRVVGADGSLVYCAREPDAMESAATRRPCSIEIVDRRTGVWSYWRTVE